ncbi:predicted protein [Histoplasma mississippiense (nom. inval.)]|uniref:predicted protein n=1 Tax=Ajellomyces capsulatus (strain NAm1 / WU24) TaxID=2059318 RepID=UPI000157C05E|nr:predicted protein [Histoplasma mississippiense (nom. inval.)]EDN06634.1 predicted protein [Histoplasma mississippiense (nom. inval.)]
MALELSEEGFNIAPNTVWKILRKAGMKKTKPTRKPGLTNKMKHERLQWCLDHQDWTLEDWKRVIWSDEASVILLHRRGGYRIWRTSKERFSRSCIRERWKGSSEFIFWGCFSYDKKGPCHCWSPETAQEKAQSVKDIDSLNEMMEPIKKAEWELQNGIRRLNLRQLPGPQPIWKWKKETGKLSRGKSNGIDWYRYQVKILLPKLFPFANECEKERPNTIVQEDRAPAHDHYIQHHIYEIHHIQRMLWCANSPDLNTIEPAWTWMKRKTTVKGAPQNRAAAIAIWERTWRDLPQEQIQAWIERIPVHIKKVIELEGGNEYKEGRLH